MATTAASSSAAASFRALRVVSFNVLAPCYNILKDGTDPDRERFHTARYVARAEEVAQMLRRTEADVLCVQEMYFDDAFIDTFEKELQQCYHSAYLKRHGSLRDGVATYVKKNIWIDNVTTLSFNDVSFQNALIVHLSRNNTRFLVANTHLTYPHDDYYDALRELQMKAIAQAMEQIAKAEITRAASPKDNAESERASICSIVCGDMNGPPEDGVYAYMLSSGYRSSFMDIHGREIGVSHKTHSGELVPADYIFWKNFFADSTFMSPTKHQVYLSQVRLNRAFRHRLERGGKTWRQFQVHNRRCQMGDLHWFLSSHAQKPIVPHVRLGVGSCLMLPQEISDKAWPETFTMSDHRPLMADMVYL